MSLYLLGHPVTHSPAKNTPLANPTVGFSLGALVQALITVWAEASVGGRASGWASLPRGAPAPTGLGPLRLGAPSPRLCQSHGPTQDPTCTLSSSSPRTEEAESERRGFVHIRTEGPLVLFPSSSPWAPRFLTPRVAGEETLWPCSPGSKRAQQAWEGRGGTRRTLSICLLIPAVSCAYKLETLLPTGNCTISAFSLKQRLTLD